MKKAIVIGCPGSGKSYFSKRLSEKTGLTLCHLDMIFWNSDRTTVSREIFLERLGRVLETDQWIIDGNYSFSMEMRLKMCDTVFFFDISTEECLKGVAERRGKERTDMPWKESDYPIDEEFLQFIKNFKRDREPQIRTLLEKYPEKTVHIFKSRADADSFLNRIADVN